MTKALVLYHSQEHGNTAAMAVAVAQGLRDAGCEVDSHNTDDGRFDIKQFPQYDCVAFGSPDYYSYLAGGIKTFMDDHYIADVRDGMERLREKPYVLFYSHGGGGRVKEAMERVFRRVGTLIGEPLGCRGKPDEQTLQACRALGKKLAASIS